MTLDDKRQAVRECKRLFDNFCEDLDTSPTDEMFKTFCCAMIFKLSEEVHALQSVYSIIVSGLNRKSEYEHPSAGVEN